MNSRHNANKKKSRNKLIPHRALLFIFSLGIFVALYFLYPHDFFERHFKSAEDVSVTSLAYLKQLNKQFKGNESLGLKVIRHQIKLGYTKDAERSLREYQRQQNSAESEEEEVWLSYILAREKFYQLKKGSLQYSKRKKLLIAHLKKLLSLTNTETEYSLLTDDSLALGEAAFSTQLYKELFHLYPDQSMSIYAKAAKSALYSGDYTTSANYYFNAQQLASTPKEKRRYFMAGISSLEASGNVKFAFLAAQKNIRKLPKNKKLIIFMAKLALRANNPSVAQSYLIKVLYEQESQA